MTTHAMEEADALGDRVVVLSRGKVQVQGTSLDLKKRFGVGFHLHVVTRDRGARWCQPTETSKSLRLEHTEEDTTPEDSDAATTTRFDAELVKNTLKKHVSEEGAEEVKILTNVGTECSLTLPGETARFPALFTELEDRREELGIEQIALSMTTLEVGAGC